ncbi:hypothetical protein CFOL_v3_04009 [Cephalotus follicularis]|uniref:Uncharacterized protein n=1 Tax=Cephalotus follicularis TaxID=3775 RepID=A0A1Q3AXN4_CEPFO|nr:hypothetical protein CFOL_v3_04009 [Cephalotus follicularis]
MVSALEKVVATEMLCPQRSTQPSSLLTPTNLLLLLKIILMFMCNLQMCFGLIPVGFPMAQLQTTNLLNFAHHLFVKKPQSVPINLLTLAHKQLRRKYCSHSREASPVIPTIPWLLRSLMATHVLISVVCFVTQLDLWTKSFYRTRALLESWLLFYQV